MNKDKRPNVLTILIDDMGWRDLGCTGSTFYESPNIDKLMNEGVIFDNAYSSCPVCSPARASLLTGKYPATVGVTDWIDHSGKIHPCRGKLIDAPYRKNLSYDEYTIAQALKDEGYNTYHVGKWHLGESEHYPEKHGFDVNVGGCSWGHPRFGYFAPYHIGTLPEGPEGEYLTDRITDEAIRLIRNNDDKPFYMNLCHYTVHTPLGAPEEDIEYFENKARRLGLDKINPILQGEHFPTEHKKDKIVERRLIQSNTIYAAMIRNLDKNIGKLMHELETLGIKDNTVIIFTSDNGGLATSEGCPTSNLPAIEGKGWLYEGGLRVPLSITYPGLTTTGMHRKAPTSTVDIYPTILDIVGARKRIPESVEGISLVEEIREGNTPDRPIFWHYPHYGNQGGTPGSAVRYGNWKLIEFYEDEHLELYNVEDDISEETECSREFPEITEKLRNYLDSWKLRIKAEIPQKNPNA